VSISNVSFTSGVSPADSQSSTNQVQQSFKQLANSLQAGDLASAQEAFTTLQTLLQNQAASQSASTQPASTQNSPVQHDFAALAQALSSGDLSAAQSDFSKLQSDLKTASQSGASGSAQSAGSAHHGHRHRHASGASDSASTDTSASTASTAASTPVAGSTISVYA
jgi:ribosomal protein S20